MARAARREGDSDALVADSGARSTSGSRLAPPPGARRARCSAMSTDGAKLVHAARVGDDAKVKRLLKAKVDVNYEVDGTEGCTGITALHEACVSTPAS